MVPWLLRTPPKVLPNETFLLVNHTESSEAEEETFMEKVFADALPGSLSSSAFSNCWWHWVSCYSDSPVGLIRTCQAFPLEIPSLNSHTPCEYSKGLFPGRQLPAAGAAGMIAVSVEHPWRLLELVSCPALPFPFPALSFLPFTCPLLPSPALLFSPLPSFLLRKTLMVFFAYHVFIELFQKMHLLCTVALPR